MHAKYIKEDVEELKVQEQEEPQMFKPKTQEEIQDIEEEVGDPRPYSFWIEFAKELSKLIGIPVTLKAYNFDENKAFRILSFQIGNLGALDINHTWRHDGSMEKPHTTLTFWRKGIDEEDVDLGRYALWDKVEWYAEDINKIVDELLKADLDESSKEEIFKPKNKEEVIQKMREAELDEFILKDGRIAWVYENTFPGMAGEPMTILNAIDENGQELAIKDIMNLLQPEDRKVIGEWVDNLDDANAASADAWVR